MPVIRQAPPRARPRGNKKPVAEPVVETPPVEQKAPPQPIITPPVKIVPIIPEPVVDPKLHPVVDEEPEDEEAEDVVDDGSYLCKKCEKTHRATSKKGKNHIEYAE